MKYQKIHTIFTLEYKFIIIAFILATLFGCTESENIPEAKMEETSDIPQEKVVKEQIVYVPIYSSIYTVEEKSLIHLCATLSIRNTSLQHHIVVTKVDYYDTNGKLIKMYVPQPFLLPPLATKDFVVRQRELAGGTGANFLVTWKSEHPVSHPIVQAVMIGTHGGLGISFVCEGVEINE